MLAVIIPGRVRSHGKRARNRLARDDATGSAGCVEAGIEVTETGSNGGKPGGIGVSSGTVTDDPQPGHFPVVPAAESGVLIVLPQPGHANLIIYWPHSSEN